MNKKHILILSIIILFFFILNFSTINKKEIFVDEAITYNMVNKLSYKEILSGLDVHPPLYYLFIKSLPNRDNFFMLRFYSLLITVISIIIFSSFLYKHFSFKHSLIVTLFMSLSMTISHYSIEARMYSLLLLFGVMSLKYMVEKKYYSSLTMIILSILTHYYSVFLLIPYIVSLYIYDIKELKKSLSESLKRVRIVVSLFLILLLVLSPYILHQINDNTYRIKPPSDKPNVLSLPSTLIFPFIIPSMIKDNTLFYYSILVIIIMLYLIFSNKITTINNYCLMSFLTLLFLFFLSFLNIPYHHRYTIIFFPQIYFLMSNKLSKLNILFRIQLLFIILMFLFITTSQYHLNPPDELLQLSKDIECPKKILHETPFSFLPMRMYLPNCEHYIYIGNDWKGVTYKTIYSNPRYVNQLDEEYDIYLHNFDKLIAKSLLRKSPDVELIRIG